MSACDDVSSHEDERDEYRWIDESDPDYQPIRLRDGFKAVREMVQGREVQIICAPMHYPRGPSFLMVVGDALLEAHWNPKRKKGLWRLAWIDGFRNPVKLSNPNASAVNAANTMLEFKFTGGAWRGAGPDWHQKVLWWDHVKLERCDEPSFERRAVEARDFTPIGLSHGLKCVGGDVFMRNPRLKMGRVCGYCTSINDLSSLVLGELRGGPPELADEPKRGPTTLRGF